MLQVIFGLIIVSYLLLGIRSMRHAGIALGLAWASYTMEQFLQHANPFFVRYGSLINFATVALLVLALASAFSKGKIQRFRLTQAHWWWIGLIFLAGLSIVWSLNPLYSFTKFKSALPYIIGFSLIAPFCSYDHRQIDKAIRVVIYFGGLVIIGVMFSSFSRRSIVIAYDTAGNEIEGNPLAVASFAGYIVICCVFSFYAYPKLAIARLLKVSLALLCLYMIVRTGSRGQLIAVIAVCFIWVPITASMAFRRFNIAMLFFGFVFTVALAVLAWTLIGMETDLAWRWRSERLQTDQVGRFESAIQLLTYYYYAGPIHWLVGIGNSSSFTILRTYPHIVPLEVLGEEGIIGFTFFAGFITVVFRQGIRAMRVNSLDKKARINMGAMLSIFTFLCILCLKQGSLIGSPDLFGVGMCIALTSHRILAGTISFTNYYQHG